MSKITRFYYRLLSILSEKLAIGEKLTFGHPWCSISSYNSLVLQVDSKQYPSLLDDQNLQSLSDQYLPVRNKDWIMAALAW